jgi:hypothetical protein
MSHVEIAGRMEMTPKQVKALLHRARTSLRRAWERAEGWLIAPLFGFRRIIDPRSENASQAGSNLVAVSPAMPVFAERVATSAAMVAIALTAFPAGSVTTPLPSPSVRTADTDVAVVADQMVPKSDFVVELEDEDEAGAEEVVAPSEVIAPDVLDTLSATVKGGSKHKSDDSNGGDGDDDGGSIPVRPAGANEIVRQAKEELKRLPIPEEGLAPLN